MEAIVRRRATASPRRRGARRRLIAFLVLLVAYVLSQFFRAFLAIVAGDLSRDLGLDAADLGSVSAIWFAAFALAQFPVGGALDRLGPRRTIAGFMLFAVARRGRLAASRGVRRSLAAMALIGIGCAPVLMGSLYLFGRIYPLHRFAMLSSLMIGLGSVGNLLGATPLALAAEAFGWRTAMAAIAGITARERRARLRRPARSAGDRARGGHAMRMAGSAKSCAGRPCGRSFRSPLSAMPFVIAIRSLWIAPYLGEVHGFDATQRGNAALVMAIAMSLGALAYGPLERALASPKLTTLIGSLLTGACLVALGLLGETSATLAVTLLAVIGAAGLTYAILMAHARLFFPARLLGRGVTFMNFVVIGGAGIVQWFSGLLVQAGRNAGLPADMIYGRLFLAFGVTLIAAVLVYALAPKGPRAA